jgi:hypothetical protein
MRRICRISIVLAVVAAGGVGRIAALETDQFYAWGRPLEDAADALNAKVNSEIGAVLESESSHRAGSVDSCEQVTDRVADRFRFFLFHPVEIWAANSPLVQRIPGDAEEDREYPRRFLYRAGYPWDTLLWVPPSPTIQLDGVRLGTDKLSHFFSVGWRYYHHYRKEMHSLGDSALAERHVIRFGILTERTLLGKAASGIFSVADLEANFDGLRFYRSLCGDERPLLAVRDGTWVQARPFDIREYVTPEWDESYNPCIYGRLRWRMVEPVLRGYCAQLGDPDVRARREAYAARHGTTLTGTVLQEMVAAKEIDDPSRFSIDTVCGSQSSTARRFNPPSRR